MLNHWAEWVASIATIIAAMMTAVNLGARVTGFGFVIFTVGSIGWVVVGVSSGQTSLIVTDGFLTVVNLIGIWRWLGIQRAHEDGGKSARSNSRRSAAPTLFTATGVAGMPVVLTTGEQLGKAVEGLIECRSAAISYVVVSTAEAAGIAEQLRAVPLNALTFEDNRILLGMPRAAFEQLAPLPPSDWPATAN